VNIDTTPLPMSDAAPAFSKSDYVGAPEAMSILGIRQQTLYAYVSRGLIASIGQANRKDRLYLRADVERMGMRSLARAGQGALAASAMNWGNPIVQTTITEITPMGPRYRGHLASHLARKRVPLESVAELLWTGFLSETPVRWSVKELSAELRRMTEAMVSPDATNQLLEIFGLVTMQLGVERGPEAAAAERGQGGRIYDAARQIIQTLVACLGFAGPTAGLRSMHDGETLVQGVARSLGLEESEENLEALEAILTLFADHELSPGTLCARVCASGGSALHSCIASGACAIAGLDIGREYLKVDAFLEGKLTSSVLMQRVSEAQERGVVIPGFVHPVYPHGDPRGRYLLEVLGRRKRVSKQSKVLLKFVEDMGDHLGLYPRHEFGTVALARAVGMPKQVPGALFGLARTIGWVAHVQEQRTMGSLLRPRAQFVASEA
jgi:citrate synthase